MAKGKVSKGDRFAKVDAPNIAWRVIRTQKIFNELPHAVLVQEVWEGRQMMISFMGLGISSLYTRLVA